MVKFILPPPEPVVQLHRETEQCDWCGELADCTISANPITNGHYDFATEIQLLKTSSFSKSKPVKVLAEKVWHDQAVYAAICDQCVRKINNLIKKGAH